MSEMVGNTIAAMECCTKRKCRNCIRLNNEFRQEEACRLDLLSDALSLLKTQEPVPVGEKVEGFCEAPEFYSCGFCKNAIRQPWGYCPPKYAIDACGGIHEMSNPNKLAEAWKFAFKTMMECGLLAFDEEEDG